MALTNKLEPGKFICENLTVDSGSVIIEFIDIGYEHRRRGYATMAVKDLQSRYELKWDYRFSEVGRKWYDGLLKKGVISV